MEDSSQSILPSISLSPNKDFLTASLDSVSSNVPGITLRPSSTVTQRGISSTNLPSQLTNFVESSLPNSRLNLSTNTDRALPSSIHDVTNSLLLSAPSRGSPIQFSDAQVQRTTLRRSLQDPMLLNLDENSRSQLIKDMGYIKANLHLRHSLAFFSAFLLVARFCQEFLDEVTSGTQILLVIYAYLCYSFLEEIRFSLKYKTSNTDTKIHCIYAGLDVFSLICSLSILHLKFLKILPSAKTASIPGLVICSLFYFSSYKRKGAKRLFIVKRILETISVYLIEAKTDGIISLPWKSLLAYVWIYIGIRIILLFSSLKAMKSFVPRHSRRANMLLTLWHYIYILLLLTGLLTYIGYSQVFDSKGDYELLRGCLVGGQYCSALLILLTLFAKPFLVVIFSRLSSMNYQSNEFGQVLVDPLSIGTSKRVETEQKEFLFWRKSMVFYQPLSKKAQQKENEGQMAREEVHREESSCGVCCQEAADGVNWDCGHGGFCYNCAIKVLLLGGRCMFCRKTVEGVVKIEPKPVSENVFRGWMIGKVGVGADNTRCQWFFK